MSYYQRHMFLCLNQRDPGERQSCADCGAKAALDHAKARVKSLGIAGAGKVRVQKAGCLDRCEEGPVAVVYPEGIWYHYVDNADIDEIIDSHLVKGVPVERLRI
jgi:(2Fe-2S) ferredoxin